MGILVREEAGEGRELFTLVLLGFLPDKVGDDHKGAHRSGIQRPKHQSLVHTTAYEWSQEPCKWDSPIQYP